MENGWTPTPRYGKFHKKNVFFIETFPKLYDNCCIFQHGLELLQYKCTLQLQWIRWRDSFLFSRYGISHHTCSGHNHNTGIEYSRGKIAIFPLSNDDLSEDQEFLMSWSCELVQK